MAKTRGPNKQPPWFRSPDTGVSVLRVALDIADLAQRRRVESIFACAFKVHRALQRDAVKRTRAFWAAHIERERRGAAAVRERLGLTRPALERAAYAHLDRAPHLRDFTTKAMAMHLADAVWKPIERHLFSDATGKRHGVPRVGRWFDFTCIPGRARSHTKARKWETFRLHGSLSGHRAAYTNTAGKFFQPRKMRRIASPRGGWWTHGGPLVLVFTGLPGGDLALPVRLPAAPSNQAALDHHVADPSRWHKVDLVRRRDPNAPGGWRYEAHLMVLTQPYASPATTARRAVAATSTASRAAGIDVNVSNVSVASHVDGADFQVSRIERDNGARETSRELARRERRRNRRLERSRRAANPGQYELSRRQIERARRREAAGLPAANVIPRGPRKASRDGKPTRAYAKDLVSQTYRRERAAQAASAASIAQARRQRAREIAASVVLVHGIRAVIEDCNLAAWARLWGRSLAAFSPGLLISAIEREMTAVAQLAGASGGLTRVPTATTALSQHCLCGAQTPKTLDARVHACPACGLTGDRDAVSAALASFVRSPAEHSALRVDFKWARTALSDATRKTLRDTIRVSSKGRQDVPTESNAHSARDGSSVEEKGPTPELMAARRNAGDVLQAIPNETGARWTKSDRLRETASLSRKGGRRKLPPLRDKS